MKKVIESKIYNTETAETVCEWSNGASHSDFNHCEETLYHTKKGAWFIHGQGGALSPYAESLEGGRSHGGGEDIIPLTDAEAQAWLENHRGGAALEKWFKDMLEEA